MVMVSCLNILSPKAHMKTLIPSRLNQLVAAIVSTAVLAMVTPLLAPMSANAAIAGPYAADTNTPYLFHFDEPLSVSSSNTVNAGTKGGTSYTVTNATSGNGLATPPAVTNMLGKTSYTGFGYCVSGTNSLDPASNPTLGGLVGYDGNNNGAYNADVNGSGTPSVDAIMVTNLNICFTNNGPSGNSPWTMEALVCSTGLVSGVNQEIVCMDAANTAAGRRGFQFRLTGSGQLELNLCPGGNTLGPDITASLPTSGNDKFVANTWYHAAATYDGTNVTLYWTILNPTNGACHQIGNKTAWTSSTNLALAYGPFVIGNENRGSSGTEVFRGLIDEVRISKVCRSPGQMMFVSDAVIIVKQPSSQSIDYYQPVTFSVIASSPTTMGYLWRFNGTAISGATNDSFTIASVDSARVGDYDVVVTNTAGYTATSQAAHLIVGCDKFLAHRWSFTNNTVDNVGGANGTLQGSATVNSTSLVLDGTTGCYMELPSYLIKNSNYTAVTFEFWANYGTSGDNDRVFDFGNTNFVNFFVPPPENYVYFSPRSGANHTLGIAGGSSQSQESAVATGNLDGQYMHVACVVDPPNHVMAIYTNGILEMSTNINTSLDNISDEKCWVGRSLFTADAYLNASIDELRIYSGALASNSIYQSYLQGPDVPLNHGPVTILVQPTNTVCAVGLPASFVPVIIGNSPILYQWYENGSPVPGGTNMSLTLYPTLAQNGHIFQVMATNNVDGTNFSAVSSNATLTVRVPVSLTWAGAGGDWDTSSLNWTTNNNASQTIYYESDSVTFDNLGYTQPTVNLTSTLHPSAVTASGTTSYTLSGVGSIAGSGSLTKSGASTLIINTTNSYTGGTTISGGTLQVGDGTYTGKIGTGPVTNNAALVFSPGTSGSTTVSNTISGSGSLTLNGSSSGTVTVTASNSYAGGTTVSGGSLRPQNAAALGTGSIVVSSSSAQLFVDANVNLNPPSLTLNGSGISSDGALRKGGSGATALGGTVTLGSDTTINVDGGSTLNLTDVAGLNGTSANANLTLAGSGAGNVTGPVALGTGGLTVNGGTWSLGNSINNYGGRTVINGGRLMVNAATALGTAPGSFTSDQITMGNGSTAGVLGTYTSFALDDGLRGIYISTTVPAAAGFFVASNAVLTISNTISGSGGIAKSGNGTLLLKCDNSFSGTLNLDTGSTFTNDGVVRIAAPNAIAGVSVLTASNNNSGVSTLQLDGSAGSMNVSPYYMFWSGRNNNTPTVENVSGDNTFSPGTVNWNGGGGIYMIQSDANTLTVSATIPATAPTGYRSMVFSGSGNILMSGAVVDGDGGANNCTNSIIKNGSGILTLTGNSSNTGTNYVSAGIMLVDGSVGTNIMTVGGGQLGGVGTINGPTIVASGGTLAPGDQAVGTLNINNNLALAGTVLIAVNRSLTPSNSLVNLTSGMVVTNTGAARVVVTNLGTALAVGNTFKVFSQAVSNGAAMTVGGYGAAWNNNLAVDGTVSLASTTLPVPVITTITLNGTSLVISGTNGYTGGGFYVLSQTNLTVPRSSWTRVSTNQFGTGGVFSVTNTVVPGTAESFFTIQWQ
jgi:autotransporter-associated beta strand protein